MSRGVVYMLPEKLESDPNGESCVGPMTEVFQTLLKVAYSFIGSTCRSEWSSSSCRWCITAFITRLHGT